MNSDFKKVQANVEAAYFSAADPIDRADILALFSRADCPESLEFLTQRIAEAASGKLTCYELWGLATALAGKLVERYPERVLELLCVLLQALGNESGLDKQGFAIAANGLARFATSSVITSPDVAAAYAKALDQLTVSYRRHHVDDQDETCWNTIRNLTSIPEVKS